MDQRPCRRPISEKLRDHIDIHIDSMIVHARSSPQLQTDMEKLVDLVHCYQHRRGYAKQMRLDAWTAVLPSAPDRASCGTSIERKIELCFGRLTTRCIGITRENKRCKKTIAGQKAQNCSKTINEISKAEVYLNDMNLDYFLRVLATNMYCHLHTKQSSSKKMTLWKERIRDIVKRASSVQVELEESKTTGVFREQASAKTPTASLNQKYTLSSKYSGKISSPSSPSIDSIRSPVTHWPDQYDTTPFDIVERSDSPDNCKVSYDMIRRQMMERLDADDQKNGYLYVYEVEGNKGFVKIGYTTRSIKKRHEEWCFDCNRQPKPLFPIPTTKATLVPNARRVEALCHAELRYRQAIIYCYGCFKIHQEWFEVSPTEAIAVIEKWSAWMKKKPYQPDQLLLKEAEARKASDMDQYMNDLLT